MLWCGTHHTLLNQPRSRLRGNDKGLCLISIFILGCEKIKDNGGVVYRRYINHPFWLHILPLDLIFYSTVVHGTSFIIK